VQNEEEETVEETKNINCNPYYMANGTTEQCLYIRKKSKWLHSQQHDHFENWEITWVGRRLKNKYSSCKSIFIHITSTENIQLCKTHSKGAYAFRSLRFSTCFQNQKNWIKKIQSRKSH